MSTFPNSNLTVGKYLISPLIRIAECGSYSASVSIKSGRGSSTHDRVLRLIGRFRTPEKAHRFALDEGIDYLRPRFAASVALPLRTQGAE